MVDLLLIVLLMFAGSGLGTLVGNAIPNAPVEAIAFTAATGGLVGAVTAYVILALIKSVTNRVRPSPPRSELHAPSRSQPSSFRKRMARFAGKSEDDVLADERYESAMPFWTAVDAILRFPPKSTALIRASLLEIRRRLRR